MPFNGSGSFAPPGANYPAVSNTLITAANRNAVDADFASGLSTCITKDGQTTVTANIPLNGNKLTGVGAATARTDAATLATIQDGIGVYIGTVGGTADVITLTPSPAISAYAAGQTFRWIASGANTGAVTVAISGLAAQAITKNGTTALVAGDIPSGAVIVINYDGTRFQLVGYMPTGVFLPLAGGTMTGTLNVPDNLMRVVGSADATKKLAFEVDGFTPATTRTITPPNANLTLPNASVAGQIPYASSVGVLSMAAALNKAIYGLTYANNGADATNDLDIAAGGCMDATGAYWITLSALTKQSDVAWAVGTAAGGLDTGAVGNSDYYIWAIARSDTGVTDILYSLSSTAPTMPASYDFKRLIGWFKRVAGTIVAFTTYETEGGGLDLLWTSPTLDVNLANTLTTSRRTDAVKVPLNFSVIAHLNVMIEDVAANFAWVYCPDQTDLAPSQTAAPLANFGGNSASALTMNQQMEIRTSSSGLIAARGNVATIDAYRVSTMGFTWARRN